MTKYTPSQQLVIDTADANLLVSASAGTGKTTVMIERIFQLIASGQVDIDNIMVVTFTNLAAAEMKHRLSQKLQLAKTNAHIAEQLEKLDGCAISTLHSFCSDLLRTYFYIADIDPSYTILDMLTTNALQQQALDEVLEGYYNADDAVFDELYLIFADNRRDVKLRETIIAQHEFANTLVDYRQWYDNSRANYLTLNNSDNILIMAMQQDIVDNFCEISVGWRALGELMQACGLDKHAKECYYNSSLLTIRQCGIEQMTDYISNIQLAKVPPLLAKSVPLGIDIQMLRDSVADTKKSTTTLLDKYHNLLEGKSWQQLVQESTATVTYIDKLAELADNFAYKYNLIKKQRGVLDFGDLEHLALKVLEDNTALEQIHRKYTLLFVDEYQDTNAVQEAIITKLAQQNNLFAVGDIKQSIYAFRGCDPMIFLSKYNSYNDGKGELGKVIELNDNFRSNKQILQFVNTVFAHIMTLSFGKVNYKDNAQLKGSLMPSSSQVAVNIDIIDNSVLTEGQLDKVYDIVNSKKQRASVTQGKVIADRIRNIVGSTVQLPDGSTKHIDYGDIAILSRSMTDKSRQIYNQLVESNIPVVASLKSGDSLGKEVRELITILRVIDNMDNDIYMVGCCLASYARLTEQELAHIGLSVADKKVSFYKKLIQYCQDNKDSISDKIQRLLQLIEKIRLVSHSACVDEVLLRLIIETDYQLYTQALPNGRLRARALYEYVDSLKGAYYAQSIDKYLRYIDNGNQESSVGLSGSNAVRMMTMHASKGLEFPVVFVVNTESQFNIDNDKIATNKNIGIAMDYYDFDNMTSSVSIAQFCTNLTNVVSAKEEEMRLLYVALTRAKYNLYVVASGAKLLYSEANRVLSANSHASWIMSALSARYGEVKDGFCLDDIRVTLWSDIEYKEAIVQDKALLLRNQDDNLGNALASINFVYPYLDAVDVPGKVVSSQLDVRRLSQEEKYSVVTLDGATQIAVDIGTAYHCLLEAVDIDSDYDDIRDTLNKLVQSGEVAGDIAESIDIDLALKCLRNEQLRSLMDGKVYREIPFMLSVPYADIADTDITDNVILQGIVDMLIVRENSATVIDYKYVANSSKVDERYYRQIQSYVLATSHITKIDNVDGYILSIKDNKLVKVV